MLYIHVHIHTHITALGVGLLALECARSPSVDFVYGFDIEEANVECSLENAERNELNHKTDFLLADSFTPLKDSDRSRLPPSLR